jgi:homotetrameric cytidine deaminase
MDFSKLSRDDVGRLAQAATAAAKNAYAPYSHFYVGAALLLQNGEIVTGANFENASYGLTICAERAAVGSAIARFGPKTRITAVYIVNRNNAASAPCGACRQVLSEFAGPEAPVYFPPRQASSSSRFLHCCLSASSCEGKQSQLPQRTIPAANGRECAEPRTDK